MLRILWLLEYIKIEDYEVEDDEEGNEDVVLILYVPISAKTRPFKNRLKKTEELLIHAIEFLSENNYKSIIGTNQTLHHFKLIRV